MSSATSQGNTGRPDTVVIVRVPECLKGRKATTLRQLRNEGNQVWKDAVQGQTKGLLKRFRAIFETRYVIWIPNPAVTGPERGRPMRALTLHQPWATLIAEGYKHFETRSWRPPAVRMGERIAIHAGKVTDTWFRKSPLVTRALGADALPSGAIVALIVLASVHRTPVMGGMPEALRDAPPGRPRDRVRRLRPRPVDLAAGGYPAAPRTRRTPRKPDPLDGPPGNSPALRAATGLARPRRPGPPRTAQNRHPPGTISPHALPALSPGPGEPFPAAYGPPTVKETERDSKPALRGSPGRRSGI